MPLATIPPTLFQLADLPNVVERARPAVVSVVAEVLIGYSLFTRQPIYDQASGTGFFFDSQGYLLTNNHVIADAIGVTVTLDDGRQLDASVLGGDLLTDLAVLKVDGAGFPTLPIGDSSRIRVGDWVIAIGNALALPGGPTVTLGVVSALGRQLDEPQSNITLYDLIQTDAVINPGNSGGPLLDLNGQVVGINTAIIRDSLAEGIGFAIPTDTFVPVSQQLRAKGQVDWPYMGVGVDNLSPATAVKLDLAPRSGVVVTRVLPNSPASQAGLKLNDVIRSMGGIPIPDVPAFIKALRFSFKIGDTVELSVVRDGKPITLMMALGGRQ